jgi:CHAT domain-containing protein
MSWIKKIPILSEKSLDALTTWAIGDRQSPLDDAPYKLEPLPVEVIKDGVEAVVRYALEHIPENPATRFWSLLHRNAQKPDPVAARHAGDDFVKGIDWRQGFAAGALMALDEHPFPDSDGVFQGLETARSVLVSQATLAQVSLQVGFDSPLPMAVSPFANEAVQEVLQRLNDIVKLQHQLDEWPNVLAQDLQRFPDQMVNVLNTAQQRFPTIKTMAPAPFATRLVTSLRALMEEMLGTQQIDMMGALDKTLGIVACRYGSNRDVVMASHRAAITNGTIFNDQATQNVVAHCLENLLSAAYWLEDEDAQATIHQGIGLVLRKMTRKAPGLLDAIWHLERSVTLRRSLHQQVEAQGAQIDLTPILIQYGSLLEQMIDAPELVKDWELVSEAYLQEAIDELSRLDDNLVARAYLGEAWHNLARLYQLQGKLERAADAAKAALETGQDVENKDLEARASLILSEVHPDPIGAAKHGAAAAALVQEVRKGMAEENIAVAWVGNKQGAFSSQIDFLIGDALNTLGEERVCPLLLAALEDSRGLTYNRWLGVDTAFDIHRVQEALDKDDNTVLAVYAVGQKQTGVVLLSAKTNPQLQVLEISPTQIDAMMRAHLSGLKQQGDVRHLPLWNALQEEFRRDAAALIAPLEPYAQQGKSLCLVPHRSLHALGLHTLSGDNNEEPLGLRVPVYTNPSLTNWLLCRQRPVNIAKACLAIAPPSGEAVHFAGAATLRLPIEEAGFDVMELTDKMCDLPSLSESFGVLHLMCHGLFREPREQYGLLLAAKGESAPSALGDIKSSTLNLHLATPARLRKNKIAGQLTFLSSCVSARNQEMPGDDLMGLTRAVFASEAASLIAGAWTVNTEYALPFANAFYSALGQSGTATAMLEARRAVASISPDPFFWGAFVLQGADVKPNTGE